MPFQLKSECDDCKHYRGIVNSWNEGCDASPDGFTHEFLQKSDEVDIIKLSECNNGIHFELKEEEQMILPILEFGKRK